MDVQLSDPVFRSSALSADDLADRIDSRAESPSRHDRILSALAGGAAALLQAPDLARGLVRLITALGEAAGACRVVITENFVRPDGVLGMFTMHEWVAPGIPSRIADERLQGAPCRPHWRESLLRDVPVVVRVADLPADEQALFRRHRLASFVSVPLFCRGHWWGMLTVSVAAPGLQWRTAEIDAVRLAGAIIGPALERAAVLDELRASEARFRDAIENIDDGFCLFDADDRLVLSNARYREMYERSVRSIVPGRRFEDIARLGVEDGLYPRAKGREEAWIAERVAAHRNPGVVGEHPMWDGRWIRAVERRTADGGTVGVRTDITALKQREAELEGARDRAEAANRAKTAFLAAMSHELRTPLNAIIGFAEMIKNEMLGPIGVPRYRDYGSDILCSGRHLLAVIDDILDLSRIEAGRLELHPEAIDIDGLLDEVTRTAAASAHGGRVTIERHGAAGITVSADRRALRQILGNIVSNAVKFSPADATVAVTVEPLPRALRIAVRDHGIGMSPEDIQRLGQPFVQVGRTDTAYKQGTGLGIAIARGLATLHGGSIAFDSSKGSGTRVTITLPLGY